MGNLFKKSIAISPLVATGIGILVFTLTLINAISEISQDRGMDRNQIAVNTSILKTQLPELYAAIGQLKSEAGNLKLADETIRGDVKSIKESLLRQEKILTQMWEDRYSKMRPFPPPAKEIKIPRNIDDSNN